MSETIVAPSTIVRSWNAGNATLSGLHSLLPGRLVVSFDPNLNQTAVVTLTTSAPELADLIQAEVVPSGKTSFRVDERGIHAMGSQQQLKLSLTQLTLHSPIAFLTTSSETIVHDGSLSLQNNAANVVVTSLGSGNVWVNALNPISVSKLDISSGGSGNVSVAAPSVSAIKRIKLSALDGGSVILQAPSVLSEELKTSVLGQGSVFVNGTVVTSELQSEVVGSGSINYYPVGHCNDSKVTILGSGNAYVASVACFETKVSLAGSGSAYVQAIDTLARSGYGSGSVKYYNVTPAHLPKAKKYQWFTPTPAQVVPTADNVYITFDVAPEPTTLKEGVEFHIVQQTGWFPWPTSETSAPVGSSALATRMGSSTSTCNLGVGALAIVLLAMVAFVVFKKRQRLGYASLQ
ncbi:hypothetical protein H310_07232 [Aphanomyces invadans]|uniref:Putative auto-transporter adhesin head GIN domain-containing protein n=1 Tax=Aphanomyces invadans TaxID=157072 RepID=A0A024U4V6_9STRA|nr:hypothetical protein H310_07232 [Aphanomyces invadans]ETW00668.1 hypothetical protein H310_07232 [Aphanomyces invadans]|eukprot:XP_008870803.1 hypothetical protein H310_07232 [Aphanomyces invadans]